MNNTEERSVCFFIFFIDYITIIKQYSIVVYFYQYIFLNIFFEFPEKMIFLILEWLYWTQMSEFINKWPNTSTNEPLKRPLTSVWDIRRQPWVSFLNESYSAFTNQYITFNSLPHKHFSVTLCLRAHNSAAGDHEKDLRAPSWFHPWTMNKRRNKQRWRLWKHWKYTGQDVYF